MHQAPVSHVLSFSLPFRGEGWGGGTVAERSNGPISELKKAKRLKRTQGPPPTQQFLESPSPATAFRPSVLIRNKHPTARKPAWILVNKLIRIKREPKNSLFP
jgi:hypothetical protein